MEKALKGNGQTTLTACGCGRLHFTYGPITLHFEPVEFLSFAGDAAEAAAQWQKLEGAAGIPLEINNRRPTTCH